MNVKNKFTERSEELGTSNGYSFRQVNEPNYTADNVM